MIACEWCDKPLPLDHEKFRNHLATCRAREDQP